MRPSTFSIVACDLGKREWGVAVASKFLAVGAVVNWAQAEVGAVATQALARVGYGPDGLALLEQGKSADETLKTLIQADDDRAERQVGIVDRAGHAAAHTGQNCLDWAGHRVGQGYTCQGNILTGPEVLEAMVESFEASSGELADRLLLALRAGDEAGGDKRGKQSAAVLVVRKGGGYGGDTDRYLDLRVDDDPEPTQRLRELAAMHHVFFKPAIEPDFVRIEAEVAQELQRLTRRLGYYTGEVNGDWDQASRESFEELINNENLEERWSQDQDPDLIDRVALDYLRLRFSGED
ncbi:MAG: DUF1028 domain-containing protein [Chloroflexi bacterium]|nr:DUF1028 domain-containing protein [Chloroflexota bacterium]